ncbi:MAG: GNAT family N-acetyltransferase [Janthinobacterium lividum]
MRDPLEDVFWGALTTSQQHLALAHGQARRYLPEVAPFAAVESQTPEAMQDLRALMEPDESVYLTGLRPVELAGLRRGPAVPALQMIFPEAAPLPPVPAAILIEALSCAAAVEMVALIDVAYPGFFRKDTCRMGRYYGVRSPDGTLIAMGGERVVLGPYREVSGLCTLPSHAGEGLGTALLGRILADQRANQAISWLYVLESNRRAVNLYLHLGFEVLRRVDLYRITRVEAGQ